MKLFYFLLAFFAVNNAFCQHLPQNLQERPDGITISYFDGYDLKDLSDKIIFIGNDMKFKYADFVSFDRIDISEMKNEIGIIENYMTAEFMENLVNCTKRLPGRDVGRGYSLTLKKGDLYISTIINADLRKPGIECSSRNLRKILEAFHKL